MWAPYDFMVRLISREFGQRQKQLSRATSSSATIRRGSLQQAKLSSHAELAQLRGRLVVSHRGLRFKTTHES